MSWDRWSFAAQNLDQINPLKTKMRNVSTFYQNALYLNKKQSPTKSNWVRGTNVEWYLHTCHYNKYTNYYFHHIGILVQSFKFSEYWCKGFELGCIWSNTSKQHQARLRCWNFKVFTTNPCSWFSQISSLSCSAFVWLFPTVCFQIILQMAYVRGCRITH